MVFCCASYKYKTIHTFQKLLTNTGHHQYIIYKKNKEATSSSTRSDSLIQYVCKASIVKAQLRTSTSIEMFFTVFCIVCRTTCTKSVIAEVCEVQLIIFWG